MELLQVADLTPAERSARVQVSPKDPSRYPRYYSWPFEKILKHTLSFPVPPSKQDESKFGASNWDARYQGYRDWAVFCADEGMERAMRIMQTQMTYSRLFGDDSLDYPAIQMKKLFAAPLLRTLALHSETQEHKELQQKIFVLKYSVAPYNTSFSEDEDERCADNNVRVWRLITCFGETILDTLHDRILGPAMGWTRHYHCYRFIVPTSGACFGPDISGAVDYMHCKTEQIYMADSNKYQLCHILRKPGQRLVYMYDFGENWFHNIELLQVADRGDALQLPAADEQVKRALMKRYRSKLPKLSGVHLLDGELNCPPEDSRGCDGTAHGTGVYGAGMYGNILKKGRNHFSSGPAGSMNWREHEIRNAYYFDLEDHAMRLSKAISGKSSSKLGHKIFSSRYPSRMLHKPMVGEKIEESIVNTGTSRLSMSETIKSRPDTAEEAVCGICDRQPRIENGEKSTLLRCSRCKAVWYCGSDCQKSDWGNHKKLCCQLKEERLAYKTKKSSNK